jgi:hypothetical protein
MPAITMRDYRANHRISLNGKTLSEGLCEIHLDDEFLLVKGNRTNRIGYEQLESIRQTPTGVEIQMYPTGTVLFDGMDGALVRPLFLHLSRLRGIRWAFLLRFIDGAPIDTLECKVRVEGTAESDAVVQLYSTGVVGIPFGKDPFQLPLNDLGEIRVTDDYQFECVTPELKAILFGCEPSDLERFHRSVLRARQRVEEETATLLMEVFPALEFAQLTRLTDLLLRGKAASKSDLDSEVPWLWERVEEVIRTSAATRDSYAYLRAKAGEQLWFGLRRLSSAEKSGVDSGSAEEGPLTPSVDGAPEEGAAQEPNVQRDYLFWFMAGLESKGHQWLTVEVISGGKGFATYVYRCLDSTTKEDPFQATARVISRAMVALNFFREPLYAPQKEIDSGRFAEYKLAVRKLPYLRQARQLFVGRAIHTTPEAWQSHLDGLLTESQGG